MSLKISLPPPPHLSSPALSLSLSLFPRNSDSVQIIFASIFGTSESLYFICVTRSWVKEEAEMMRPARQRRMRVLSNNLNAVPAWSENLMQIGGQVREAKATAKVSTGRLCPVVEIDPSTKIKLQLFPIDDATRAGLEKDGHNPFLELTLRARKKISSVLKHIKGKWGNSSIARGEPVLSPYNTPKETVASCRWTVNDSEVSAGEVYAAIGCPAAFRLRYEWSSNSERTRCPLGSKLASAACELSQSKATETCPQPEDPQKRTSKAMINVCHEGRQKQVGLQEMQASGEEEILPCQPENHMIQGGEEKGHEAQGQSVSLWADSLTNISIGGLLSEASLMGKVDNFDSKTNGSSAQPSTVISDSFDAFIAANLKYSQSQMLPPSEPLSSILDAEDTCHAFSFKRPSPSSSSSRDFPTSSESGYFGVRPQENCSRASKFPKTTKDDGMSKNQPGVPKDDEHQESQMVLSLCSRVYNDESSLGLAGIHWTDTLGPFDLGLPSRKVVSRDSIGLGGSAQ